jgi:hypothetical protein
MEECVIPDPVRTLFWDDVKGTALEANAWRQASRALARRAGPPAEALSMLVRASSEVLPRTRDNRLLLSQPYKSAGEFVDGVFLLAAAGFAAGQ